MRSYVLLYVNGQRYEVRLPQANKMLSDFLRYDLKLIGTKVVCAEGDCGACTVLRIFPLSSQKIPESINSCITSVGQMDCSHLITVDGITPLNEVQKSMVERHGSQCGF